MVDSVVIWARNYKVDGFRFDLMGHHRKANMLAVRSALDALTLAKDGVDGKVDLPLRRGLELRRGRRQRALRPGDAGSAWRHRASAPSPTACATRVRGGGPFDEDPRVQGFGSGEATDPNGAAINGRRGQQRPRQRHRPGPARAGRQPARRSPSAARRPATVVNGTQVDYNGSPAGYADQPDEVVSYVDAHDNETLFDALTYKLPRGDVDGRTGCG